MKKPLEVLTRQELEQQRVDEFKPETIECEMDQCTRIGLYFPCYLEHMKTHCPFYVSYKAQEEKGK